MCGTQLDETYYLKNNVAAFVANVFSQSDKSSKALKMVALEDPEEVMWKLVSR